MQTTNFDIQTISSEATAVKPRLLVTISFSFSIRYLYRTGLLQQLKQFANVVIAITWNEEDLINELKSDGFEVHLIPESKTDVAYTEVRKKINYWFKFFKLQSPSQNIQPTYLKQYQSSKVILVNSLREKYNYLKFLTPGYTKKLFARERELLTSNTNYNDMLSLVEKLNIDSVFTVTPFHAQEDIFLRACKDSGKKMYTSILSFDNITKRGWIPVNYDLYMVWNKYNKEQVLRIYPGAANDGNVSVVGAAQFDFYWKDEFVLPKNEWLQMLGLPQTNRKIILYAGGPKSLFPNEPQYLKHFADAIKNNSITGKPLILFRCHPIDNVERWKQAIGDTEDVYFDTSWTGAKNLNYANITSHDIQKLCSTLAHTDVHINLCSTMTIDGSAYNKPQIAPAYDEVNKSKQHLLRSMYYQEHFMPIMKMKSLRMASSKEDLIDAVNEALTTPAKFTNSCQQILEEIITYTDGQSTDRVVAALEQAMGLEEEFATAKNLQATSL